MATPHGRALLDELQALADAAPAGCRVREAGAITLSGHRLPLPVFLLGDADPALPGFAVVAGVHGLERIGVEVALAFLRSLLARLAWDEALHQLLARLHVVLMPVINPGGLLRGTRANPAGEIGRAHV